MTTTNMPDTSDRVVSRIWEWDSSSAGTAKSPKKRPANRKRQKIVSFLGQDDGIERFAIVQTVPYCGYEEPCPPSQAQYTAAVQFYMEGCESRFQAHTILCARDYEEVIAKSLPITGYRREFLWFCIAAFILSDRDLRARVRAWSDKSGFGGIASGIATHRPYKKVTLFASKLIDDMRGCGSTVFG